MAKFIERRLEKFDSEINLKFNELREKEAYQDKNLKEILDFITNKTENSKYMKSFYIKSRRKANECPKAESYQVIDLKDRTINSANTSIENQSVTSSKSSYKSTRRVTIKEPIKPILKNNNNPSSTNRMNSLNNNNSNNTQQSIISFFYISFF